MDEELGRFLEENMKDIKPIFEQHKVYSIRALRMISDLQFERMGLAIGQIATVKAFLSAEDKAAEDSKVHSEERIQHLVEKIRKDTSKADRQPKSQHLHLQALKKRQPVNKQRKMYLGWLHRSTNESRYKQVRMKDGGGIRDFTYSDDDEITVDFLKAKASKLFFPEGESKFGALAEMNIEVGNFAQKSITTFTNIDGEKCTFQEYLKSRGLFASRSYIYLMSTSTGEEKEISARASSRQEDYSQLKLSAQFAETVSNKESDVFMGVGKTEISEEFENLMSSNSSSTPKKSRAVQEGRESPVYVLKDMAGSTSTEQTIRENRLNISYEYITESSYSEVFVKSVSFSIAQCYELLSLNEPLTQDNDLEDFDPLDNGFTVFDITKGGKCFVDRCYTESSTEEEFKYIFPQAKPQSSSLIIHPPSEIWGYDGNQLIVGVVASCHLATNAWYVWSRDGRKIKEGKKCCCLPIKAPGSYSVEVHFGEQKATSEPVLVCSFSELEPSGSSLPVPSTSANESHATLPVVEKEEIQFSTKDVIGRGSFGVVYRGQWAGTDVAVKHVKVRNAKRIQSVVETEVKVHSMVRHPNIVQIMAISFLKNSIYIVSELIQGHNLEELIFSDGENSAAFTIQSCDKLYVGKQICQAVAYLHNLKPPVVHRDIKPANVLVASSTHVTKLCDMGLSKLKSVQSISQTTSTAIPGTPSYMAPECLLERKRATVHSDVWSVACTLIELFTEKDCWEQLLDDGEDDSKIDSLIAVMARKEIPQSLQSLATTISATLQHTLTACCQYDISKRPRAIDIVKAFS